MKYPINYDFGKNWNDKIIPFLDNPKIIKSIRKGVNDFSNKKVYKKNTAPAFYTSSDAYATLIMEQEEIILNQLRESNTLPKEYLDLEKEDDDDDDEKLYNMREKILEPYFTWDNIKNKLETYVLHHSCFYWAPTFEITLARLVMPEEKWRVQSGDNHATVINENNTKVFDLLYWASIDGRLYNYLFGKKMDKIDKTLGGKQAYLDSLS